MTRFTPRSAVLFAVLATAAARSGRLRLRRGPRRHLGHRGRRDHRPTARHDGARGAAVHRRDRATRHHRAPRDHGYRRGHRDSAAGIAYDTSPDAVVLRLSSGGGFVPMEIAFLEVPQLVVYGDGRVITADTKAQVDFQNLPATAPLLERTLDEDGMQALLLAAQEHGLLEGTSPDYGQPNVTDSPGTSLSIAANGTDASHQAYALGFDDPAAPPLHPGSARRAQGAHRLHRRGARPRHARRRARHRRRALRARSASACDASSSSATRPPARSSVSRGPRPPATRPRRTSAPSCPAPRPPRSPRRSRTRAPTTAGR